MKTKIKKYLFHTTIFVGGLILGVVIMGYLSARAGKTFLEAFRISYYVEQLELAAKAHREGDKYAEFVCRNNVVDMLPMGKLKVIEDMKTTWTFSFPFAAPILDLITDVPELERGRRISYGIELGRLAEATEHIGLKEEADKLWKESVKLIGHNDINRVRSLVAGFHKAEDDANAQMGKNRRNGR
jgi:hypothetical protein